MDIFVDYTSRRQTYDGKHANKELLVLNTELSQGNTTGNRNVQALEYSSFYPELLAVAYDRNPEMPLAPEGIVNVWNVHCKTSPE